MSEPIILIEIGRGLDIIGTPPPAQLGVAYNFSFQALGGVPPYTWDLDGTPLTGLTWTAATANLAGTVNDPGTAPITVSLLDGQRQKVNASFVLQANPLPLSITGHLNGGRIGDAASGSYSGSGGVPPYTIQVISGALPDGVTLNPDGTPTGSFTAAAAYDWQVRIRDSQTPPAEAVISDSASVLWPVLTLTGTYPDATSGAAYNEYLVITGGNGIYSNSRDASGTHPIGLDYSIVNVSGEWRLYLGGSPTTDASYSFIAAVDSSDGQTGTSAQTIEISTTYATMNPSDKSSNITLSNGNLTALGTARGSGFVRSVQALTGKKYFEFVLGIAGGGVHTGTPSAAAGITKSTVPLTSAPGVTSDGWQLWGEGTGKGFVSRPINGVAFQVVDGDRGGFAIDVPNGYLWVRLNGGAWIGGGDPTTGSSPSMTGLSGVLHAILCPWNSSTTSTIVFNPSLFVDVPPSGFGPVTA